MQLLLCTDLDRTVLPNGSQPESDGARSRFAALAARPEVTLVYVTGRDRQLVTRAITNYCLPQPDYVISDVGTMIYEVNDDSWRIWREWQQEIAPDWAGLSQGDIRKLLLDVADLQMQEPARQNLYKSSFYVPLYADTEALAHAIRQRLEAGGVRANLVWSIDEPRGVGLLDVLPARASKQHAVFFLMQRNGYALDDTVFAGDSGNDLPVLVSEIPAVLVANASAEVRDAALAQAAARGHADALYIAQGGFMDMNGNYTAGVLEGVVHYQPEIRNWLMENTDGVHANGGY
jgi:HAD superfamily hydrolase (TIGR01484 family)